MISEQEKQYCICDNCVKLDKCEYYKGIKESLNFYINTPLNVHFINCKNYKSVLISLFETIENKEPIKYNMRGTE